jgi:hypothetical protein
MRDDVMQKWRAYAYYTWTDAERRKAHELEPERGLITESRALTPAVEFHFEARNLTEARARGQQMAAEIGEADEGWMRLIRAVVSNYDSADWKVVVISGSPRRLVPHANA